MSTQRSLTRVAGLLAVASLAFAACSSSGVERGPVRPAASAAAGAGGASQDADRRRQEGRPADDHRPAARLVQLRRGDRRLQGQVRPRRQRAQPRRRLRRRDRGDQGQQGQHGPAGAGRHRRRPLVRPVGQDRRPARSPTRSRPGTRSPTAPRTPTAPGTATTTACCRSRSNKDVVTNVAAGLGRPARSPSTRTRSRSPATRAPRTRRSRPSTPPALANGGSLDDAAAGPRLLQRAQQGRQLRAGHRQGRRRSAQGATPIVIRWDYNALADRDTLQRQPAGRRRRPEDRRRRRRLRAGDQRLRAASRTPPSCGWSISTPTRASSAG